LVIWKEGVELRERSGDLEGGGVVVEMGEGRGAGVRIRTIFEKGL
jgi:hypothetical protein